MAENDKNYLYARSYMIPKKPIIENKAEKGLSDIPSYIKDSMKYLVFRTIDYLKLIKAGLEKDFILMII